MRHWVWIVLLILLVGCAAPADDTGLGVGRSSPEAAVDGFLEDLNLALRDPSLAERVTQQRWAERLAGYFAPSEQLTQRVAFNEMLAGFADTTRNPIFGNRATLEIAYTRIQLLNREGNAALVQVVDGSFNLRWLNEQGDVIRERTGSLTEVIGQQSGGIPVIQVDGLWYLTEE